MFLNKPILDIKNALLKDDDGNEILLSEIVTFSLLQAEVKQTETFRKAKRFLIANKIATNIDKDLTNILTVKDIAEIMDAVITCQPPLSVGRVAEVLDPNVLKENVD